MITLLKARSEIEMYKYNKLRMPYSVSRDRSLLSFMFKV